MFVLFSRIYLRLSVFKNTKDIEKTTIHVAKQRLMPPISVCYGVCMFPFLERVI